MKDSIFAYKDYKKYVTDLIRTLPKGGRGVRSQLAEAVGCQVAYISQILNGHLHLSVEQGLRLNRFFSHSKDESHFFLLLLQWARAGDHETRAYFQELLDREVAQRLVLTRRLGLAQGIKPEDQVTYYSSWYYSAVHILLTIPSYQTKGKIAERLGLSLELTTDILEFLSRTGLAKHIADRFLPGEAQIHLDQNSKLTSRSHANWRIRGMAALDNPSSADVHYTGVFSLSKPDSLKLKSLILKQIEEVVGVVKDSKEEELAVFCLDLFRP